MTTDKELERQKELHRITNCYRRTFGTEDGEKVLANLKAYFRMTRPAFERGLSNHNYDPIAAALRDGQREVILFIEHKLSQPVVADGDVDQPKTTVTRE
jgi:hypothetical protein